MKVDLKVKASKRKTLPAQYPALAEYIAEGRAKGTIFFFKDANEGFVVKGSDAWEFGGVSTTLTPIGDTKVWKILPVGTEINLTLKQN